MKIKFVLAVSAFIASTISLFGQPYDMEPLREPDEEMMMTNEMQEPCDEECSSCSSCSCVCSCSDCCPDCECECCPPKDPCAKCAQLWPSCGPDWMITPGAGPCVDGCDLFITAEFIYWAIRQDHMGFAFSSPTSNTVLSQGEFFHPKWRMEPGFRVGIGWVTCMDGWDLYLNYTWLQGRTKNKNVSPKTGFTLYDTNFSYGTAFVPEDTLEIQQESAKWRLNFNVLDFEWGRNFYISQCLYLRPHFGLKGTWQKQRYIISGTAEQQQGSTQSFHTVTASGNHKIHYWGVGPRAGLDSAWHFSKCFSVLGEVAASALWGRFESKSTAVQTNQATTVKTAVDKGNLKTEWHTVKPVLEFLLGVRWEDWWCCDTFYTALDLGWEVQWWGGQNQFVVWNTETRWGDLGLQGLTLRFRFQF